MLFRTAIALTMASAAMAFSSTPANGSSRTALSMGLKVGDAFPKDAVRFIRLVSKQIRFLYRTAKKKVPIDTIKISQCVPFSIRYIQLKKWKIGD